MSAPQNRCPFLTLRTRNPFSPRRQKAFRHLNAKLFSSLLLSNLLEALPTNMYCQTSLVFHRGIIQTRCLTDLPERLFQGNTVNRTLSPERNSSLDSSSIRKHYLFSSKLLTSWSDHSQNDPFIASSLHAALAGKGTDLRQLPSEGVASVSALFLSKESHLKWCCTAGLPTWQMASHRCIVRLPQGLEVHQGKFHH